MPKQYSLKKIVLTCFFVFIFFYSMNCRAHNEKPRTVAVDQIRGTYAAVFGYTDANPNDPSIVIAEKRSLGPGYKPKPVIFQEFSENPNPGGFLRHEFGHSLDISLNYISHTPAFRTAYKDDISRIVDPKLKKLPEHYLVACSNGDTTFRREEIFAELFAYKYGGGIESKATDEMLHRSFPNLSGFIDQKIEQTISEQRADQVQ